MPAERGSLKPQRRSRKIAFTDAELDAFLTGERTCRVASVGSDGPHVAPLWFAWLRPNLWLYSITRSQRWVDLENDPRIAIVADAGEEYFALRGVEIRGRVEPVGDNPRVGDPHEELTFVEAEFTRKYFGGTAMGYDGRHAWLRVVPDKITSWDFRKISAD